MDGIVEAVRVSMKREEDRLERDIGETLDP